MGNKNQYGEDFIVCLNCKVFHVQNCGSCFGYGFFESGGLVNAGYAHEFNESGEVFSPDNFQSCKECGSDIRGQLNG